MNPVYESPRLSIETAEPLYEDITLSSINTAMIMETVVPTKPNEAYTPRIIVTKHATVDNIGMEENQAYTVGKTIKHVAVHNIRLKDNEAYAARTNHVTVHSISMEDNEAYKLLN